MPYPDLRLIPSHVETQFPENPKEEVTFPLLAIVAPYSPRLTAVEGICIASHSAEVEGPFSLPSPYRGSWHKLEILLLLTQAALFEDVPHVHEMFWEKVIRTPRVTKTR